MGNVPKIRFQGFTEDWEQQKAGDVLIERNVQHAQSKEFPLVSFTVENGVTPKVDRYEREQLVRGDKKAKKYKETRLDDIVYNPANLKFGAIARNKYGNAVFSPIYITYEVNDRLALPAFIEMLVTRNRFIQNALRYQQGTVYERMAVNTEDFAALDMSLPSVEEQSKIGTLFNKLDSAIFMHKRKLDETQTLKQYLLRNMFPAPGEAVPAIRFEGFSGEWEEKKFGELTELKSASRVHKEEWQVNGIPFYRSSDVMAALNGTENEKAYISEELYEKLSAVSGKLEKGDVLVTGGGSVGKPYIVPNNDPLYTKDADLLWIKRSEQLDPYFIYTFFLSPGFAGYLSSVSHVGTIAHYTITQLSETPISLPVVEEQKKIGVFFAEFDESINHTKQKIAALNTLKQYLLQNMFPTKG